ncbi:transposase for insertion sequence element IS200 [Salmonella enterica subsp. enterica serovar Typhimurium str. DT104]|nr:transposase for insertion sequence element IS200 [Salmonella enterica subsp. enterica serovar Typhimurium str. DT104]
MTTQYGFFIDSSRCTGCKTCELACKDYKDLTPDVSFRRIYEYAGGDWQEDNGVWHQNVFAYYLSISCNHCEDPACTKVCPSGAMHKRDDGFVIVFAPKYRRQAFYGEKRRAVGSILRKLCEWKNVRILEAECCADHIHMLLEIPPKMSVSSFMGYLKGKSSLMLYEQFGDLKFKYRNREFWCRGYYVDTVGKNTAKIQDYIKHQLEEDKMGEQLSIPYPGSPFTGRK